MENKTSSFWDDFDDYLGVDLNELQDSAKPAPAKPIAKPIAKPVAKPTPVQAQPRQAPVQPAQPTPQAKPIPAQAQAEERAEESSYNNPNDLEAKQEKERKEQEAMRIAQQKKADEESYNAVKNLDTKDFAEKQLDVARMKKASERSEAEKQALANAKKIQEREAREKIRKHAYDTYNEDSFESSEDAIRDALNSFGYF